MERCACMNVFALSRRAGRRYNRADPELAREFQHRQLRGCGRPRRPQARSWQTVMVRGDRRRLVVSVEAAASRCVDHHICRGACACSCKVGHGVDQQHPGHARVAEEAPWAPPFTPSRASSAPPKHMTFVAILLFCCCFTTSQKEKKSLDRMPSNSGVRYVQ